MKLTVEQKSIYDKIISAVNEDKGGLFFLYDHGGTGKTFIWKTLSFGVRSKGDIVINVASSSIASLLLPGGRTAHSRFAILLNPTKDSTCNIKQALDQTLRDILRFKDPSILDRPFGGIPNHSIALKVGVPVMLLRNIDQSSGLCNGTRLIITKLENRVIEAKVLLGKMAGDKVFIPRMTLTPSDTRIPFKFQRRQFLVILSFAMTINKSQCQSLCNVGLFLKKHVFAHGQLYVALSRATSRKGLKILCYDEDGKITKEATNIVYKEVFQNLEDISFE
ncbi:uncharacterized protein LOC107832100 [Nicotiana tabacum]|uniref:Uncharacterized protein LOC107832100 n=1 Tax=Nicotiana tabacum TaxID=4097 RepID=A0AC58UBG4_TOBAC